MTIDMIIHQIKKGNLEKYFSSRVGLSGKKFPGKAQR
jgi:hypothetical protein